MGEVDKGRQRTWLAPQGDTCQGVREGKELGAVVDIPQIP